MLQRPRWSESHMRWSDYGQAQISPFMGALMHSCNCRRHFKLICMHDEWLPSDSTVPQYEMADLRFAINAAEREVGKAVPAQRSLQTCLAARR